MSLTAEGAKALIAGLVLGVLISVGTVYFFPSLWPRVLVLPVAVDHPGVDSAQFSYSFKGAIKTIEKLADGNTRLTLDIANGSLPEFIVASDTLFFRSEGALVASKLEDLAVGSSATLQMSYDLGEKAWQLTAVILEVPSQ